MERGENSLQNDGQNAQIHRTVFEISPLFLLVVRFVSGDNVHDGTGVWVQIGASGGVWPEFLQENIKEPPARYVPTERGAKELLIATSNVQFGPLVAEIGALEGKLGGVPWGSTAAGRRRTLRCGQGRKRALTEPFEGVPGPFLVKFSGLRVEKCPFSA